MFKVLSILAFLLVALSSYASIIYVPADQPTVQAGIDVAVDGDTVLVAPGTYTENIDFSGKRIVVGSSGGPDVTTLQAANPGLAVVYMSSGEPKGATISAFTITGGGQGGVYCDGSSPRILGNVFVGNSSDSNNDGAGVELNNSQSAVVWGNIFRDNTAHTYGAAIHMEHGSQDDTIAYNVMYNNIGQGEIRVLTTSPGLEIFNNTIHDADYAAIITHTGATAHARNNIIFGSDRYAMHDNAGGIVAEYNCTYGNAVGDYNGNVTVGPGNIYVDALLSGPDDGDFSLTQLSPCIDAGDPDPLFNDPDGTRNDIGALYFSSSYAGPVWHVDVLGSDSAGDGSDALPYATIQHAIDQSDNGDTILVHEGSYIGDGNRDINTLGKAIVVRADGEVTIVIERNDANPSEQWRAFRFDSGEDTLTVIDGFTLVRSHAFLPALTGGAVIAFGSSPLIRNCVIQGFRAGLGGGAVYLEDSSPVFDSCLFLNNFAGYSGKSDEDKQRVDPSGCFADWGCGAGGAINACRSPLVLRNCTIRGSYNEGGHGGAVCCADAPLTAVDCVFDSNTVGSYCVTGDGGAVYCSESSSFTRCQFTGNKNMSNRGGAVFGPAVFDDCAFRFNYTLFAGPGGAVSGDCEFHDCVFVENGRSVSGSGSGSTTAGVFEGTGAFYNCTFFANFSKHGDIFRFTDSASHFENCVISFSDTLQFGTLSSPTCDGFATFHCCDIYGNVAGDWQGEIAGQLGVNGNFSANPQFCDTSSASLAISNCSPCSPDRNDCGILIGADSIDCSVYCGPVWHVDVQGNDSVGDGNAASPFATIQHAVDRAWDGDTVLLAPGVYTGDGNRDVLISDVSLTLIGTSGPDSAVVDCQAEAIDPHRGMVVMGDSTQVCSIMSITVRNAYAPEDYPPPGGASFAGGGFLCIGNQVVFEDMLFDGSSAVAGASVAGFGSHIVLKRCVFSSSSGGDIGDVCVFDGSLLVDSCSFLSSTSRSLSCCEVQAVVVGSSFRNAEDCFISFCCSRGDEVLSVNDCDFEGAGEAAVTSQGSRAHALSLFNSRFAQNGRALQTFREVDSCSVVGCTFSENEVALDIGGEWYTTTHIAIDSCIFVANGGTVSPIIRTDTEVKMSIRRSTLYANSVLDNPLISMAYSFGVGELVVENCLISFNEHSIPIYRSSQTPSDSFGISCNNIFGNSGGDYVGWLTDLLGVDGNIAANPLFCDTANNDFGLMDISPCAPAYNSCSTLIGAFGVDCSAPLVDAVTVDTVGDNQHVLSDWPLLQWQVVGASEPTERFELAVGTDDDWQFAEMWNPAPFNSPDTQIVYGGSALSDGTTYHIRIRVDFGPAWSPWYEISFHTNSAPGTPTQLWPLDWSTTDGLVTIWLANATDAESDLLAYEIEGFHDTDCVFGPPIDTTGVPEGPDSTGIFYDLTAAENCFYCWTARAFDGYEYGEWSQGSCFYVDGVPEAPTMPGPIYPVEPEFGVLYDMTPEFLWSRGLDGDPADTVWHRLEVAIDRNFSFVQTVDSLTDNRYTLPDSLEFNDRYWWRVTAFDMDGFESTSPPESLWTWTLGDMDHSHEVSLGDLTVLIDHLFISLDPIQPPRVGDLDGNCAVSLGDLTVLIDHLFISLNPITTVGCDLTRDDVER